MIGDCKIVKKKNTCYNSYFIYSVMKQNIKLSSFFIYFFNSESRTVNVTKYSILVFYNTFVYVYYKSYREDID